MNGGASAATPDSSPPPASAAPGLRSTLETARLVVAPTTLLTALLFYFGWVYTNARALFFGIDPSTLGYSTQDYILRSADPVFLPVSALLILSVVLLRAHATLARWIETGRHPEAIRWVSPAIAIVGAGLLVNGVAGVVDHPLVGARGIVTPLGLGAGVGLLTYATSLWHKLHPNQAGPPGAPSLTPASVTLVCLLMIVSLFAAVGDWADTIGVQRAKRLAGQIPERPGVVVYSKERLQIDALGVRVSAVGDADSAYRFRYTGLKLLIRSGGKYFLLPARWSPSDGVAIVLADHNDLRFEFTPK